MINQRNKSINKFITSYLILVIIIIAVLSSCTTSKAHNNIDDTLSYLTSDELAGRFAGSEGNKMTQEFLANSLAKYGIEEYKDSYYDVFEYQLLEPIETQLKIGDRVFEENQDYFIKNVCEMSDEYPLTTKDNIDNECVLLLDENDKAYEYFDNENVKAVLINSNEISNFTPRIESVGDMLVFSINEETYDYLLKKVGDKIYLECKYEIAEKQDNNIVGIIKGKDAKNAIVISAHFDHIGSKGDTIFRGALDNASGTSAVLEVAKTLSEQIEEGEYAVDIIFAFFNAEEIGLYGSKSFAEKVQKQYGYSKVLNINIDCIGDRESNTLTIYQTPSNVARTVSEMLNQELNNNSEINVLTSDHEESSSDNKCFNNYIYVYEIQKYIHSTEDIKEKLNADIIEDFSNCLSNVIVKFAQNPVVEEEVNEISEEMLALENAKNELENFQYKFIEIAGEITYVDRKTIYGYYKDCNQYFDNELDLLPQSLKEHEGEIYLGVNFYFSSDIEYQNQDIDKIYFRNYNYMDISYIDINIFSESDLSDLKQMTQVTLIKVDKNDKSYERVMEFYTNRFGDKIFEYKGYEIYYKLDAECGDVGVMNIVSKTEDENYTYLYSIADNLITEFDEEKLTELIEKYDILTMLATMEDFTEKDGETNYYIDN